MVICMYSKMIEKMIDDKKEGTLFIINDFKGVSSYETIKKVVQRLVLRGKLEKVIDGIYMKPGYSEKWNINVSCNIYELAECIARKNGWDIVPTGELAVNYFGLSTQLQAKYIYVSSGPYKSYQYGNNEISFKHTASRKLFNMSKMVQYLIQAINYYGKDNFNDEAISIINNNVSDELIDTALKEAVMVDAWIYEIIKRIKEYKNSD